MFVILRKLSPALDRLRLPIAITYFKIDASQGLPLFPLKKKTLPWLCDQRVTLYRRLWVHVHKNTKETINGFENYEKRWNFIFFSARERAR